MSTEAQDILALLPIAFIGPSCIAWIYSDSKWRNSFPIKHWGKINLITLIIYLIFIGWYIFNMK